LRVVGRCGVRSLNSAGICAPKLYTLPGSMKVAPRRCASASPWRISGSAFYRNKEKALAGLWEFMEDAGVNPNN
jgi:hypothetical protein